MEKFELDKAKGVLKKCVTSKKKTQDGDTFVLQNDVHLIVVVDSRCEKAADYLFPAYADMENQIAGRDGEHPGLEMQTRGDVPELNVTIFDGGGTNEVFQFDRITLNSKPKLLINSVGDSRLVLRLNARLSKKDMSKLVDYVEADVYVSAVVVQPELPGISNKKPEEREVVTMTRPKAEPAQQNLDGSMSGDDLRRLRGELGRKEFAEKLAEHDVHVSPKSLQRYEGGIRDIPPDFGMKVRTIFG